MPGFLLHAGATVLCMHGGQAQSTMVVPRVRVGGQPVVTQTSMYVIAGCVQQLPVGPPCVTAQWVSGATRVRAERVPVLLQDSQAVCTAPGTGLNIAATQMRVKGV